MIDGARAAAAVGDWPKYDTDVKGFISKAYHDVPRVPLFQPYPERRRRRRTSPATATGSTAKSTTARWSKHDARELLIRTAPLPCSPTSCAASSTVIPTLIGVVIVTFLLTRVLPGDPAVYFAGPAATPQSIDEIRKSLGLDQAADRSSSCATSTTSPTAISAIRLPPAGRCLPKSPQRLPASAELTLFGLFISIVIAIPLGILAAVKQGSWIDHTCRIVATAGVSLPVFFTGLLLVYVFYFRLGWAPAPLGRLDVFYDAPPHVTGFYLIDSLIAGDFELFRASLEPARSAGR